MLQAMLQIFFLSKYTTPPLLTLDPDSRQIQDSVTILHLLTKQALFYYYRLSSICIRTVWKNYEQHLQVQMPWHEQ